MPQLLHILTKTEDELAKQIIAEQQKDPQNQIEIVDVSNGVPDYKALTEKIFAADSVQVW
ncbi:MAG: hypothetical protein ACK4UN_07495 [Limisphaerales bacterium]